MNVQINLYKLWEGGKASRANRVQYHSYLT